MTLRAPDVNRCGGEAEIDYLTIRSGACRRSVNPTRRRARTRLVRSASRSADDRTHRFFQVSVPDDVEVRRDRRLTAADAMASWHASFGEVLVSRRRQKTRQRRH